MIFTTQNFSAIKAEHDYNAEQNDEFSALTSNISNVYKAEQHWRVKSRLDYNGATPPSGRNFN